nr:MAG TPA: hypothetical protein [Caudoviricetes sp.]
MFRVSGNQQPGPDLLVQLHVQASHLHLSQSEYLLTSVILKYPDWNVNRKISLLEYFFENCYH